MINYFFEFKNRIFFCGLMWVILTLTFYFYKENLLYFILQPNKNNIFIKYIIFTNIMEVFAIYLKLVYFFGYQFLSFFIFYHFIVYFSTAFYFNEYFILKLFFLIIFIYWLIVFMLYLNFLGPMIWFFFLTFQKSIIDKRLNIYFEIHLNDLAFFFFNYYYFYILGCLIFFSLFIVIQLKLNSLILIKKNRIFIYFLMLLSTIFLVPFDVLNQIFIALYLFFCFEFLVFLKLAVNLSLK